MSHRLQRVKPVPQWPSYNSVSHFVGSSPSGRVAIYVDPSLGAPALKNAQDLVADADRIVNMNDQIFGIRSGSTEVIVFALNNVQDGTGGADHNDCTFKTGGAIEVDASFGNSARVGALFMAELSECAMNGNLCGVNTGEALSRWCAMVVSNNALSDYASAPAWVQSGMKDWVNKTKNSDTDEEGNGCGVAFISWLRSLGYGLDQIAPAMVSLGTNGTFAGLYAKLTKRPAAEAWNKFVSAVKILPEISSDDPFRTGNAIRPKKAPKKKKVASRRTKRGTPK